MPMLSITKILRIFQNLWSKNITLKAVCKCMRINTDFKNIHFFWCLKYSWRQFLFHQLLQPEIPCDFTVEIWKYLKSSFIRGCFSDYYNRDYNNKSNGDSDCNFTRISYIDHSSIARSFNDR